MKAHWSFFVVIWTQATVDVLLGILLLLILPLSETETLYGAVILSHLLACVFIYRDGKKFRNAESEVWSRAMTVAREVLSAYPFFLLMVVLHEIPGAEDAVSTGFPAFASLFVFGIWLQMVGPRLTDQADPNEEDYIGQPQISGTLANLISRREQRLLLRDIDTLRRSVLAPRLAAQSAYSTSFAIDVGMIIWWVGWFTNGPFVLLPVLLSHMFALTVAYVWAMRLQSVSSTRWLRATQIGRQLLFAQFFLFAVLLLQGMGIKGPVIEMTVTVLQLLLGGVWILILGPGRTAYVEARSELLRRGLP